GTHGFGHLLRQPWIHRIVGKTLAEVHRAPFGGTARDHGEDRRADVLQLAHTTSSAAARAAPATPAAGPSAAGRTGARDCSSGSNCFQFSTTPPPTTISSGQNSRLISARYRFTRTAHCSHERFSSVRLRAAARLSPSTPSTSMWPSSL